MERAFLGMAKNSVSIPVFWKSIFIVAATGLSVNQFAAWKCQTAQ
jgi:hypothetical protein